MHNIHLLEPLRKLKEEGADFSKYVITIDFDSTLSRSVVQSWAKELVQLGFDVWVVTTRRTVYNQRMTLNNSNFKCKDVEYTHYLLNNCNDKVYEIASEVGIKPAKVLFTDYEWKAVFLHDLNSLVHLDDNTEEFFQIRKFECKTIGLQVLSVTTWQNKLVRILLAQFKN